MGRELEPFILETNEPDDETYIINEELNNE
jgi:hypothetical protein